MRIGFLSDLHITHNNAMMAQAVSSVVEAYKENNLDKLFLAGDTSNNYKTTLAFLDELVKEGVDVYAIFGNHEYWSITYDKALSLNHERYINNKRMDFDRFSIISIDGYFDFSFVREVDKPYMELVSKNIEDLVVMGEQYFDLRRSKIKNHKEVFEDMINKLRMLLEETRDREVILMTHFVPSEEFISYIDDRIWNSNNAFMGSKRFRELAEKYGVSKVIFGHTHVSHEKKINGVEYYCSPVGYGSFEYEGTFRNQVKKKLKVFEY